MRLPWRHGWNIVAVALLFQAFAFGTTIASFTLFLSPWAEEFGLAHSAITMMLMASVLVGAIAAAFIGPLFDRLPPRLLVTVGALLYAAANFAISFSQSFLVLFLLFASILSIGLFLLGPVPAQVLVVRSFEGRRGMALGIVSTGMTLGGVTMPPLVAFLLEVTHDWRMVCQIEAAAMTFIVIPLILLVMRQPSREAGASVPIERVESVEPAMTRTALFRDRRFILSVLAVLPIWMTYSALQANLGPIALSSGQGLGAISAMLATLNAAGLCASILVGRIVDSADHRRLILASACLTMAGMLLFAIGSGFWSHLAACVIVGLGMGGLASILASFYCLLFGAGNIGLSMSLSGMLSRLAVIGPPIFSLAAERSGSFVVPLAMFAALGLPAIGCALILPSSRAPDRLSTPRDRVAGLSRDGRSHNG